METIGGYLRGFLRHPSRHSTKKETSVICTFGDTGLFDGIHANDE